MGRPSKEIKAKRTKSIRPLSNYYSENPEDDALVALLNRLPNDERNFMLLFIAHGNCINCLAKYFHCSDGVVKRKLDFIREKIREQIKE